MSDSVLAAIIAGAATLSASLLQLRSASLRNAITRASTPAGRRKGRVQRLILLGIVAGAAVAGFALSQWLTEGERTAQAALQRELLARVAESSHTAGQVEQTRTDVRAEIESEYRRRLGSEGVVVSATVGACHPQLPSSADATAVPAADAAAAPSRTCSEAEASPVVLCATIPANATVTDVVLFSRTAEAQTPWDANRFLPGQELDQARFADKFSEGTPEADTRQVCQGFAHWSSGHARSVRVIFHYSVT